ncbi:MAG TPA: fused response regulator/phosphatase [Methylomirabilota bacterium]|nr:fused response regulator/phosphatase [Methylomirabilota bacterium]
MSAPRPRVLVVDDEPTSRLVAGRMLEKEGFDVTVAGSAAEALHVLKHNEPEAFVAIVTDYLMPERTGLELLNDVKLHDNTLSAVVMTAIHERSLVKESLRGGACDFLDKPVHHTALLRAVRAAVEQTMRQRTLKEAECSVQEVGRFQQFMLGVNASHLPVPVEVCYHPRHAAGGDLVNVFQLDTDRLLVVIADVSGHDLKAGFVSAYFQGMVRGMVERRTPIEEVFTFFNRFLLTEWNGSHPAVASPGAVMTTSVCACALLVDLREETLTVWNCGFPIPGCADADGRWEPCGTAAGSPLGWFEEPPFTCFSRPFRPGDHVYCWTDGADELAGKLGVSVLALASRLLEARALGASLPQLRGCSDDILLVRLNPRAPARPAGGFHPLLCEHYWRAQLPLIDQLQAFWQRSLEFAVADLTAECLHDLLLCAREAVSNALKHGCSTVPNLPCLFRIAHDRERGRLRVTVSDPGPGHGFDWQSHLRGAGKQLVDQHRGLLLIHQMPASTRIARNGAEVEMEFLIRRPDRGSQPDGSAMSASTTHAHRAP